MATFIRWWNRFQLCTWAMRIRMYSCVIWPFCCHSSITLFCFHFWVLIDFWILTTHTNSNRLLKGQHFTIQSSFHYFTMLPTCLVPNSNNLSFFNLPMFTSPTWSITLNKRSLWAYLSCKVSMLNLLIIQSSSSLSRQVAFLCSLDKRLVVKPLCWLLSDFTSWCYITIQNKWLD